MAVSRGAEVIANGMIIIAATRRRGIGPDNLRTTAGKRRDRMAGQMLRLAFVKAFRQKA